MSGYPTSPSYSRGRGVHRQTFQIGYGNRISTSPQSPSLPSLTYGTGESKTGGASAYGSELLPALVSEKGGYLRSSIGNVVKSVHDRSDELEQRQFRQDSVQLRLVNKIATLERRLQGQQQAILKLAARNNAAKLEPERARTPNNAKTNAKDRQVVNHRLKAVEQEIRNEQQRRAAAFQTVSAEISVSMRGVRQAFEALNHEKNEMEHDFKLKLDDLFQVMQTSMTSMQQKSDARFAAWEKSVRNIHDAVTGDRNSLANVINQLKSDNKSLKLREMEMAKRVRRLECIISQTLSQQGNKPQAPRREKQKSTFYMPVSPTVRNQSSSSIYFGMGAVNASDQIVENKSKFYQPKSPQVKKNLPRSSSGASGFIRAEKRPSVGELVGDSQLKDIVDGESVVMGEWERQQDANPLVPAHVKEESAAKEKSKKKMQIKLMNEVYTLVEIPTEKDNESRLHSKEQKSQTVRNLPDSPKLKAENAAVHVNRSKTATKEIKRVAIDAKKTEKKAKEAEKDARNEAKSMKAYQFGKERAMTSLAEQSRDEEASTAKKAEAKRKLLRKTFLKRKEGARKPGKGKIASEKEVEGAKRSEFSDALEAKKAVKAERNTTEAFKPAKDPKTHVFSKGEVLESAKSTSNEDMKASSRMDVDEARAQRNPAVATTAVPPSPEKNAADIGVIRTNAFTKKITLAQLPQKDQSSSGIPSPNLVSNIFT